MSHNHIHIEGFIIINKKHTNYKSSTAVPGPHAFLRVSLYAFQSSSCLLCFVVAVVAVVVVIPDKKMRLAKSQKRPTCRKVFKCFITGTLPARCSADGVIVPAPAAQAPPVDKFEDDEYDFFVADGGGGILFCK